MKTHVEISVDDGDVEVRVVVAVEVGDDDDRMMSLLISFIAAVRSLMLIFTCGSCGRRSSTP